MVTKNPGKKATKATKSEEMRVDFDVDPYQGFAALIAGASQIAAPKGYRFDHAEREGTKAFVIFKKVEE